MIEKALAFVLLVWLCFAANTWFSGIFNLLTRSYEDLLWAETSSIKRWWTPWMLLGLAWGAGWLAGGERAYWMASAFSGAVYVAGTALAKGQSKAEHHLDKWMRERHGERYPGSTAASAAGPGAA